MTRLTSRPFGTTGDGRAVCCWTLEDGGAAAEVLTYGCTLRAWSVPAAEGPRDIVLGFDDLAAYEAQTTFIGQTVGRVANRIGGARFTLDGRDYLLPANDGPNCLHGGPLGFHQKVWDARAQGDALVLSCVSPAGEGGFPGTLRAEVRFCLRGGALTIEDWAQSDAPTPVNLTNHSYFNLEGAGTPSLENHTVQVFGDQITEIDGTSCPTGRLLDVEGTPFDLRRPRPVTEGLASRHPQILQGAGYDHNYVLKTAMDGELRPAAAVEAGGLRLECETTQPGVQLYTANYLDACTGKAGRAYGRRCALCLETQNWPDAVHHPAFPNPVLRPGETYRQTTVYHVGAKSASFRFRP